jgi:hypothetical protein
MTIAYRLPKALLAAALAAALTSACAPRAQGGRHRGDDRARVILLDEIQRSGTATVFELVQTHRPMWLNKRGPVSFQNDGDVVVYLDEVARVGGPASLREIATASVGAVRYLDAVEANYRFGRGHPYGAILVSTVFPVETAAAPDSQPFAHRDRTSHP